MNETIAMNVASREVGVVGDWKVRIVRRETVPPAVGRVEAVLVTQMVLGVTQKVRGVVVAQDGTGSRVVKVGMIGVVRVVRVRVALLVRRVVSGSRVVKVGMIGVVRVVRVRVEMMVRRVVSGSRAVRVGMDVAGMIAGNDMKMSRKPKPSGAAPTFLQRRVHESTGRTSPSVIDQIDPNRWSTRVPFVVDGLEMTNGATCPELLVVAREVRMPIRFPHHRRWTNPLRVRFVRPSEIVGLNL
jgi:hypothetical protein